MSFERSLPERFRRQVEAHPHRLPIEKGDRSLSYAERNGAVNAVARALLEDAAGGGQRVILFVDQGIAAVTATLGVLSAGAVYVPLNPTLPVSSLHALVAEVAPAWIIANRHYLPPANALCGNPRRILCIEEIAAETGAGAPPIAISPDALACICYTSGSTGKPKGVYDRHRNVAQNIWRYRQALQFGINDRLTLLQAPHFSGAVSSMFGALLNGAACFPCNLRREGLEPDERLASLEAHHGISFGAGDLPRGHCRG